MSARAVVVTPTFCEAGNIGALIEGVLGVGDTLDVLVVDDSSPDGTPELVADAAASRPGRVMLLSRPAKSGLGSAYVDGFAAAADAGYDRVVQMDADGSHDPAHIPAMLAALDAGADMAIGSRYVQGGSAAGLGSARRKILSLGANCYARACTGIGVRDITGGFRAYRSRLLASVDWSSLDVSGFGFQVVALAACVETGAKVAEVPIRFRPRASGSSKMSASIMAEGAKVTWGLRSGRGLRAATGLADLDLSLED